MIWGSPTSTNYIIILMNHTDTNTSLYKVHDTLQLMNQLQRIASENNKSEFLVNVVY